jgi:hypothetical protein
MPPGRIRRGPVAQQHAAHGHSSDAAHLHSVARPSVHSARGPRSCRARPVRPAGSRPSARWLMAQRVRRPERRAQAPARARRRGGASSRGGGTGRPTALEEAARRGAALTGDASSAATRAVAVEHSGPVATPVARAPATAEEKRRFSAPVRRAAAT